jgi:hypothetical protein
MQGQRDAMMLIGNCVPGISSAPRKLSGNYPESPSWEIAPALSRSGERSEPEWDPSQLTRIGKHKRVYHY